MSTNVTRKKIIRNTLQIPSSRILFCIISFLCLFLLLRQSDTVISYMNRGLLLCVRTVIPSLFPFMVLSEWMVATGSGRLLGRLCEKPMRRLFGISGAGACALVMGLICGFPIGTKTAVSLCRNKQITKEECTRLLCFCNIPSSAFLINAVGVSLYGSRRFGLILYGLCIFSSLLIARLLHLFFPLRQTYGTASDSSSVIGISAFTHAVTSSATAMLYVCAYVVFFTTLVGTLGQTLTKLGADQTVISLLFGFFELSGGVMQAAAIPDSILSGWIAALLCGWSGLSVHLQILSLCDELPDGLSGYTALYFGCKLFQGILCAILCGVILYFFPSAAASPLPPITSITPYPLTPPKTALICTAALCLGLLRVLTYHRAKRSRHRLHRKNISCS